LCRRLVGEHGGREEIGEQRREGCPSFAKLVEAFQLAEAPESGAS